MKKSNRSTNSHKGFTLVEILISLFIMSIMMTALVQLMNSTFKGMRTITQSTDLVTESQLTSPMIADRLTSSVCIFPEGSVINLGTDPTHFKNIDTGSSNTWVVGNDPILAMFLPGKANQPGTYRFFAYYPTPRTSYLATNPIGPDSNEQNDSFVWMILEYQHTITLPNRPNCNGSIPLVGGDASRYLADFVAPTNDLNHPYKMFEYDIAKEGDADQRSSVTFQVRFRRNNGGRVETVPTDGSTLSTKVYPRNFTF